MKHPKTTPVSQQSLLVQTSGDLTVDELKYIVRTAIAQASNKATVMRMTGFETN